MAKFTRLFFTVVLFSACATYRGVPMNRIPERVAAGDHVRLTMRDGSKVELVVSSVGQESISGGGETRTFDELALVERRGRPRLTPEVVLGWVAVPVVGIVLLVLII